MKKKSKKLDQHINLEETYLHYAAQLASNLGANIQTSLVNMPLEYKFKIGAIALASLTADFCYAIIDKQHPDASKNVLEQISEQAKVILESRFTPRTKQ